MQEGCREHGKADKEAENAGWCSLLFDNAAMMDRYSTLGGAMEQLARNMALLAGVGSCVIFLPGRDDAFTAAGRHGVEGAALAVIAPRGMASEAIKTKKSAVCDASSLGLEQAGAYAHTDFFCMPLISHGHAEGLAILFTAGKSTALSADTKELLAIIAIQGAHVIDEFRYKEELLKRSEEIRRVYEIQRRISRSIDLEKATESIVENAPYITKLQYCMIYLLDPQARDIVSIKAPGPVEKKFGKLRFSMDELIASRIVINERKPLFIEDARNYADISQRIVEMLGFKSAIVLPLMARDRVLGVMWLYSTDRMVRFDEDDRRSAIALSDQAAIVIDNARIFRELEESYEKLKDLDKTKMEFFTLISHELRNPLAVIKGFTELIYDGTLGPVNARQKEKLEKIRENVDKLADMVGKMADISSLESQRYPVNKTPAPLHNIVSELVDTMGFLFRNKRITLKIDMPASLPVVEADSKKLEQVLLNLLNNALKYTPEGGEVTVAASDRAADVLVSVHDTGIGIPKKDLDKIFSGFYHSGYKLSYEYKGPGLGLAISRRIIESHGGHIWAESEVGKGSTFYFTIPKHSVEPVAVKNSSGSR